MYISLECNLTARTQVRVGVCYPPGTTLKSVTYNYKDVALTDMVQPSPSHSPQPYFLRDLLAPQATSFDAMKTNPIVEPDSWSQRGKGMFYHDNTRGYIWFRVGASAFWKLSSCG
jgi:hypothetical protein